MEIYLLDGSSYIYRAFYAMRGLSTSSGLPTNAVYILTRMLFKILKEKAPTHMAFVLDSRGPTLRHLVYKEYKATRLKMPEDLEIQFPYILKIVHALGIPVLQKEGYEADDIIATLARRFRDRAYVIIVSGDKDLMQLVGQGVYVWDTMKDRFYDADAVKDKFGVYPEYIPDLLAIMGDSSDNIPGVGGIGPKGAITLINEVGHLDEILKGLDRIKQDRLKGLMKEGSANALSGLELVRLDRDIEIDIELDDLKLKGEDIKSLADVFRELEFKELLRELGPGAGLKDTGVNFKYACESDVHGSVGMFILPGLGSALNNGEENLACLDLTKYLLPLGKKDMDITIHDSKQAIVKAEKMGVKTRARLFDTMISSYCCDATSNVTRLEDLSRVYLGIDLDSKRDVLGSGKNARSLKDLSREDTAGFLASHAEVLLPLRTRLEERMHELGVENVYRDIEMPLVYVLAAMETRGVLVDKEVLSRLSEETSSDIERLEHKIYSISGRRFNINSTRQLAQILFEDLGLPPMKRTKTGYSTDSGVLEALRHRHELPGLVLDYRMLTKFKNTYIDALAGMVDPGTGRIHAKFNQCVTATGRISSSEPNLQNIPVRSEATKRIRKAFVAPRGFRILSADYSQIELRVLAHITGDKALMDSFIHDTDIHASTASEIFGVSLDEVSEEERRKAKTINFGIIYGMSAHRLAGELGIPRDMARRYIENYLDKYPGVKAYIKDTVEMAKKQGFVTTIIGRRRSIPGISSANFNEREAAKRIAVNTPIQGSAADIIKKAMVKIHSRLKALKSKMVIQVHDELVFEVEESEVDQVSAIVREEMEGAYPLSVPLKVDMGIGESWYHAH